MTEVRRAGQGDPVTRTVAAAQIDKGRAVLGLIGLRVDAVVVAVEEAGLLQPVAVQRRVGIADAETRIGPRPLPAKLPEQLSDLRGRILPPALLIEKIPGHIPVHRATGLRTAVLELDRVSRIAAVDRLNRRAGVADAVLRLERQRAAERVEPEQRIRTGHQRER